MCFSTGLPRCLALTIKEPPPNDDEETVLDDGLRVMVGFRVGTSGFLKTSSGFEVKTAAKSSSSSSSWFLLEQGFKVNQFTLLKKVLLEFGPFFVLLFFLVLKLVISRDHVICLQTKKLQGCAMKNAYILKKTRKKNSFYMIKHENCVILQI
ncbi:hypothetical protein BpHYR1_033507 [Brachionus plicatilis]|uniref:Uncharacterized protein n=1 Tax=Brachionus plicatilis TaxID=10195 RepID=A0A3M7QWL1_BRAPC|nr:hypothetical protein BpHYR1_033507 [Brachionus plicatilis]